MAKRTSSEDQSEASSTVSEFVSRRFRREVPVFGGNPLTGASELSAAVTNSLQASGLFDAIDGLNAMMRSKSYGLGRATSSYPSVGGIERPVRMVDVSGDAKTDELGLADAAKLDPSKLDLLLEASMIAPGDVQRYATLLGVARNSLEKKQLAAKSGAERRAAALRVDKFVGDDEIAALFERKAEVVTALLHDVGLSLDQLTDDQGKRDRVVAGLMRALVHESLFGGRCTNRGIALVGDAALKTMLMQWATARGISVGDASALLQRTQSNDALRNVGVAAGLTEFVRVGVNIDAESRTIMATVVEAVYGVVYMEIGMVGVEKVNSSKLMVCDFNALNASVHGI